MSDTKAKRGKGRRPGSPNTRSQILDAARSEFSSSGYDGATIRGVAGLAGVDPALVLHYFGSKEELFSAALELPVDPAGRIRQVIEASDGPLGESLVRTMLGIWDDPDNRRPLLAALRSATGDEGQVAETVRQYIRGSLMSAFSHHLSGDDAALRGALIGSQLAGILLARYVVGIEPIKSSDAESLALLYGPVLDYFATTDMGTIITEP